MCSSNVMVPLPYVCAICFFRSPLRQKNSPNHFLIRAHTLVKPASLVSMFSVSTPRWAAPYCTRPTPVAKMGLWYSSTSPPRARRIADARRQSEYLGCQFLRARQQRPAAGNHHAAGEPRQVAGALDLRSDAAEHFRHARLNDLGQFAPRDDARRAAADARNAGLGVRLVEHRQVAAAGVALHLLRGLIGGAQHDRQVAGHVVTAHREHLGVVGRSFDVDQHVGGAAAEIDQQHAEFLLVVGEHRAARRRAVPERYRSP